MDQKLKVQLEQKLALTTQMKQSLTLLKLPTNDLNEYLKNELLDNPLLNIDSLTKPKTESYSNEMNSEQVENYVYQYSNKANYFNETLEDILLEQLSYAEVSKTDFQIGKFLIQMIDNKGYLKTNEEVVANNFKVSINKIEKVIKLIQTFEPKGVGARDLKECLTLQVPSNESKLKELIEDHLYNIANNEIDTICKSLGISIEEYEFLLKEVQKLNPKPGSLYDSNSDSDYIIPDASIKKVGHQFKVIMNDRLMPQISLADEYSDLYKKASDDDKKYIDEKYKQIDEIQEGLGKRKETMKNIIGLLVAWQKDYLNYGPKYLQPLTQREVAEELTYHPSTISRAINEKYIETSQGLLSLKSFFSGNFNNNEYSSNWIMNRIKEMIDTEDKRKPLSDQRIKEFLEKEKIEISRRTVNKYREDLGIQSSVKRKIKL